MELFGTKQDQLLSFCRQRGFVSKSEIMRWGLDNFYISADRVVRTFVEDGIGRRLGKEECTMRGLKGKQAWYEFDKKWGE